MLNFTVGPVMSSPKVLAIGAEQTPYFRTPEFSKIMLENEMLVKKLAHAEQNARAVFITGSGTASMEAAIINTLTPRDKVLVINGGSFGARFVQILNLHRIENNEIKPEFGHGITAQQLEAYDRKGYTAFVVNVHETSVGVHYDMEVISSFCKRNNMFLLVDAISSFLADPFDMSHLQADVMIAGSQKALACPPGISIIVMSERALERVKNTPCECMYLDLKSALKDGERGQTPFTCAVSILRQINFRLRDIDKNGGVEAEIERIRLIAENFRNGIKDLPLTIMSKSLSNCVTPLTSVNKKSAYEIFTLLKDNYGIWVCPNGGELKEKIFRVGHIGALTFHDNRILIEALNDMNRKGLL